MSDKYTGIVKCLDFEVLEPQCLAASSLVFGNECRAVITPAFENKMHMIVHETEGKDMDSGSDGTDRDTVHSGNIVLAVAEKQLLFHSFRADMIVFRFSSLHDPSPP